jgi:Carboxypeptidase regulatory-like domain/TonB dependent receptor-like, beta-barrel
MKKFAAVCVLLFTLTFILISSATYAAETTASIIGTIYDDKGVVLPGATVTAVNVATNFTRVSTSETSGFYRVALLPPGTYTMTVEITGFIKEVRKGIELTLGKEIIQDYRLKLSAAGEIVEVVGETPLIDATKSQLGQTVDEESIKSLPLNGRDYTQLSLLAPGVKPVTLGNYGQFQIGGQRGDAVNYTIDGAENNFSYTNEARTLFTQEGVQEFMILTNRFSAEYGRATGGVINVISKSGTNEFHGNGFFFFRPDQLDAADFFADQRGVDFPVDQQQWGVTAGGPIKKDQTFFFVAFEQTNRDGSLSVSPVPRYPTGVRPKPIDLNLATAKVNHNLNEKHSMVFRYNFQDRSEAGFYAGGLYVDGVVTDVNSHSFAVSENAVFSTDSYNELLVQYGRHLREDTVEGTGPAQYRPGSVTGHHYCCPQRFEENRIEVLDTFTKVMPTAKGEHTVKFGGDYIHINSDITFAQYFGGGYYFGTDDPFDPNNPDTFPTYFFIGVGNPRNENTNHQISAFVQDDWRVNDRLTLNLGLRYDIEVFDGDESNRQVLVGDVELDHIPDVDKNNFGPRVGFAYDWKAEGKMIFRGGYGRYYKPILHNVYNNALLFDGSQYAVQAVTDPDVLAHICCGIPDPSVYEDTGFDVRPMQSADVAFTDQFSIGIQRELAKDFVINADYVYVRGHNLTREQNLNAPKTPQEILDPNFVPQFPQFGRVRLLLTNAGSWYHALQLNLQKRFANNFLFTTSYTLSKVTEDAADFFSISEPNDQANLGAEKGPGTHDQRHVFSFGGVFELPKGFQIGSIIRAASGIPVNFRILGNPNNDGFSSNDRPDLGPNDTFAFPAPGIPGNMPRNFGRGESFFQVDLRVAKNVDWSRYRIELIGEVFNLFNRTNFNFRPASVNRIVFPEDVGKPVEGFATASEVFDPLQVQFGIKLDW